MAIKPDRIIIETDVTFFSEDLMERGQVVFSSIEPESIPIVYSTWKKGRKPVGVILNDVVNADLTRCIINFIDEVQVGGKVTITSRAKIDVTQCERIRPEDLNELLNPPRCYLFCNRKGKFVKEPTKNICDRPIAYCTTPTSKDGFTQINVDMNGL